MQSIEQQIKRLCRELGAQLVGITNKERLGDGPPSADPGYSLEGAESVIAFALPLDSAKARDFISKVSWRPHGEDRKRIVRELYSIGDRLAAWLRERGFEALNVDINNNYRPEEGAADVTEMTEFRPEFSHRYAAVAAGIGRLGWSGNLMTKEYGAQVELGSVVTTARLEIDDPIPDNEHPCDGCRVCSAVCPVGMIPAREPLEIHIAGITETISRKRPNTCCWIGCTGYEGLSVSGKWSNWSPYRLGRPLPQEKEELDALCIRLQKADPQMLAADNSFADYRQAVFNPTWFYHTVCGFCRTVCSATRPERLANRKLIHNSGTAALSLDGEHVIAGEDSIEMETPYGLKVVVSREAEESPGPEQQLRADLFPLDRAVISYLQGRPPFKQTPNSD